VLEQVAEALCPISEPSPYGPPQVTAAGGVYQFSCVPAAGHSTLIVLQRLGSEAEAQAAFRVKAEGYESQDFHGGPMSAWELPHLSTADGKRRFLIWQAEAWLITIQSEDDTHFQIALDPAEAAERIYAFAQDVSLFSR
jgi:hypothetical protein